MGFSLPEFYNMTWADFFIYQEVYNETEQERLHLWRLDFTQRNNLAAHKQSQTIKPQDVIRLPMDEIKKTGKGMTFTEFRELMREKGEYNNKWSN
jgi:hypothetical protein